MEEQKDLRTEQLVNIDKSKPCVRKLLSNNEWPTNAGKQIEILTSFALNSILKTSSKFGML